MTEYTICKTLDELDTFLANELVGYTQCKTIVCTEDYWCPTRKIEQAMEILEILRLHGGFCCLELRSDFHYVWEMWVVKYDCTDFVHQSYNFLGYSVESLSELICLAAEKWIRSK